MISSSVLVGLAALAAQLGAVGRRWRIADRPLQSALHVQGDEAGARRAVDHGLGLVQHGRRASQGLASGPARQRVEQRADRIHHRDIRTLLARSDIVGGADGAVLEHERQRPGVIIHVQPVAHIAAVAGLVPCAESGTRIFLRGLP